MSYRSATTTDPQDTVGFRCAGEFALATARPAAPPSPFTISALRMEHREGWVHLSGQVAIETDSMLLKTDEVDYSSERTRDTQGDFSTDRDLIIEPTTARRGAITVFGDKLERAGAVTFFTGEVRVETDDMELNADRLDFGEQTRRIVTHGKVTIHLKKDGASQKWF